MNDSASVPTEHGVTHHPQCGARAGREDQCNCGVLLRLPKTPEQALCILRFWAESPTVKGMTWGGNEWRGLNPSFADELLMCASLLEAAARRPAPADVAQPSTNSVPVSSTLVAADAGKVDAAYRAWVGSGLDLAPYAWRQAFEGGYAAGSAAPPEPDGQAAVLSFQERHAIWNALNATPRPDATTFHYLNALYLRTQPPTKSAEQT